MVRPSGRTTSTPVTDGSARPMTSRPLPTSDVSTILPLSRRAGGIQAHKIILPTAGRGFELSTGSCLSTGDKFFDGVSAASTARMPGVSDEALSRRWRRCGVNGVRHECDAV
ncbi:hypothetical protein Abr02nite_09990 [Paractinoplanes brasiliensis]|nr:hypothetical protein Abr02nite_09990 [Actinoplanes brasiliensis]